MAESDSIVSRDGSGVEFGGAGQDGEGGRASKSSGLGFRVREGYGEGVKINWRNYSTQKPDPYWRGARIAARILRKGEAGKPLSARDRRVAHELFEDEGVSNRLIDQAVACLKAPRKF